MENDKLKYLGIVGTASELVGAFVGTMMVTGKEMHESVRKVIAGRQGYSEASVKGRTEVEAKRKTAKKPTPKPKPQDKESNTTPTGE